MSYAFDGVGKSSGSHPRDTDSIPNLVFAQPIMWPYVFHPQKYEWRVFGKKNKRAKMNKIERNTSFQREWLSNHVLLHTQHGMCESIGKSKHAGNMKASLMGTYGSNLNHTLLSHQDAIMKSKLGLIIQTKYSSI